MDMKFIHVLRYLLFYCLPPNIFSDANNTFNESKIQGECSKIFSYIIERFLPMSMSYAVCILISRSIPAVHAKTGPGQCTTSICNERSVKVDL